MSKYINNYLLQVIESHRMGHIEDLVKKYREKRAEIKTFLHEKYTSAIYNPFNSGSYKKGTAINSKFDLDIIVPFKYDAFITLEKMFEDVYDCLHKEYENTATIRKQGVSIGLVFNTDNEDIDIDIVPARETSLNSFEENKDLNLHKYNGNGYLKTNIHHQIEHIKSKNNERKVIRLLKIWKNSHQKKYKSFFIELLVIKAYEKSNPTGSLWEQLKTILEYTIDNITDMTFILRDPGNSNNNLMSTLDYASRLYLKNLFQTILTQVAVNENNIGFYFPLNKKYSKDNNSKSYGFKDNKHMISTPPTNQRFG